MDRFQNAFIFHGTASSPKDNWFPWAKRELESLRIPTIVPQFPTPEGESLQVWLNVLGQAEIAIGNNSLLIGHSKGGMFLLKVLEKLDKPVDTAVFISTPIGIKPILYYEEDQLFSNFEFDWDKIRLNAKNFVVFHSNDDPYVSMANGEHLARRLGVKLTFISKAGHINAESGFTEFPALLDALN